MDSPWQRAADAGGFLMQKLYAIQFPKIKRH
jgi:hypothetical protein